MAGATPSQPAPPNDYEAGAAKASEGIACGLYVTVTGRRVVVLHVFVKKSQKTPTAALRIARDRMKLVKP